MITSAPPLVSDVMTRRVLGVRADDSLLEAARVMSDGNVGGVAVLGPSGDVAGFVSKTDLVDRLAEGRPLADVRVGEIISGEVVETTELTPLDEALARMAFEGVHRALVRDERGDATGMLSAWDVLRAIGDRRIVLRVG